MIVSSEPETGPGDAALLNRLKYRRQFVLGPRPIVLDGIWRTHQVDPDWVLTVHEDLPFHGGTTPSGAFLGLLGFVIDPQCPQLGDAEIVDEVAQCADWEAVLRRTADLSGRWTLFHIEKGRVRVVNDAAALRSVFFLSGDHEPWCFSQPGLYHSIGPARYSDFGIEFIYSRESQKDFEACWPGGSSPFAEVEHLLPNHYLDLTARTTTRFWPRERLEPLALEASATEAANLLEQSFAAIAARGRFALAVTAGVDSRTLLAASRSVVSQAWLYTTLHGELHEESGDTTIPSAMCAAAGLDYHVLRCPKEMEDPFRTIFLKNNDPAHLVWGRICQGMSRGFPENTIAIRGNVSETARCFYYKDGVYPETITVSDLCRYAKMPSSPFVRRFFGQWLDGARHVADLGYRLLDVFYWENRMANWLGATQTEFDIVHDTFSPFSNRRLLSMLVATPIQARCKPDWMLHRLLIERMWPELLRFTINPPESQADRWIHKIRKARHQFRTLLGQRAGRVRLQAHEDGEG